MLSSVGRTAPCESRSAFLATEDVRVVFRSVFRTTGATRRVIHGTGIPAFMDFSVSLAWGSWPDDTYETIQFPASASDPCLCGGIPVHVHENQGGDPFLSVHLCYTAPVEPRRQHEARVLV